MTITELLTKINVELQSKYSTAWLVVFTGLELQLLYKSQAPPQYEHYLNLPIGKVPSDQALFPASFDQGTYDWLLLLMTNTINNGNT